MGERRSEDLCGALGHKRMNRVVYMEVLFIPVL